MPNREFLESFPLYRKYTIDIPSTLDRVEQPAIHMACQTCRSEQTLRMANEYHENFDYVNPPSGGQVVRALYVCASCRKFYRTFYIFIAEDRTFLMKVGQYPAWSIRPDARLEELLGDASGYYTKGLVCESQAYGIGAFAYYRRIVEEIIDSLLDQIVGLLTEDERSQYMSALEDTKKTVVAREKIALVKDLLPPILRPDGMNPLSVLHGSLSEGLHGRSDQECLEQASVVREILVFLVNQVAATSESAKRFTDGMRKLLEKKVQ